MIWTYIAMRARFQDQKVCVIIERVYLVIQLASVAGSSIIQFGDIGVYYRKIRQGKLSYSLTNAKRQVLFCKERETASDGQYQLF